MTKEELIEHLNFYDDDYNVVVKDGITPNREIKDVYMIYDEDLEKDVIMLYI